MLRTISTAIALALTIALAEAAGAPAHLRAESASAGLAEARLDSERAEAAGQGYVPGVFVATPDGPVELTAWAEVTRTGQLRMAKGTLENVPTLTEIRGILCNVPNWRPGGVMIASEAIFRNERAERREVKFAVRLKSISAFEVRVEDVERKDRLAQLVRDVKASEQVPAYVFIVMSTNGLNRLYPFGVRVE